MRKVVARRINKSDEKLPETPEERGRPVLHLPEDPTNEDDYSEESGPNSVCSDDLFQGRLIADFFGNPLRSIWNY
jgi:hypothetical protein